MIFSHFLVFMGFSFCCGTMEKLKFSSFLKYQFQPTGVASTNAMTWTKRFSWISSWKLMYFLWFFSDSLNILCCVWLPEYHPSAFVYLNRVQIPIWAERHMWKEPTVLGNFLFHYSQLKKCFFNSQSTVILF